MISHISKPKFNVLLWDINRDCVHVYDVFPYILESWECEPKYDWNLFAGGHCPCTFDEFKNFILHACRNRFWSRCEYEILVSGFPPRRIKVPESISEIKNLEEFINHKCDELESVKIDAYSQIEMNIDVITKLLIDYLHGKNI